jgi:hypothetical protein
MTPQHVEIDYFFLRPFPAMLKLTLLTTPLFSHAETDFTDHAPFSVMLKLTFLTMPLSSNAEIDFWSRSFPAMLKLDLSTTPLSRVSAIATPCLSYGFGAAKKYLELRKPSLLLFSYALA